MKILVIQQKRIGDVLTSTIIFELLKRKFPAATLDYLVYPNSLAVIENNPNIDNFVILTPEIKKKKFEYLHFLFQIRKSKYDIVIDAYGKPSSTILSWISGAKRRISFEKSYSKILSTDVVKRNEKSFSVATKAIEHRLKLVEPLDIAFELIAPKIYLTNDEKKQAFERLIKFNKNLSKHFIMISVLGSNESKTMPFFNMAKVLNRIAKDRDVLILFNYMPYQKKDALEIFSFCEEETQKKIAIDFYEEDLRKFIAITSQCHALIGNEGGATNMAKAIAIPTFTIFSPIVPKQDWNLFENEKTNISVHISDYTLILDTDKTNASIKEKKYEMLYQLFEPKLFEDKLVHFLDNNAIK